MTWLLVMTLCFMQEKQEIPAQGERLIAVPLPDETKAEALVAKQLTWAKTVVLDFLKKDEVSDSILASAYGRLASIYHVYGIRVSAIPAYENARTLEPDKFDWYYLPALLEKERGNYEIALSLFEKANQLEENYPALLIQLGESALSLNKMVEAENYYKKALEVNPNSAAGYYGLGETARLNEQYDQAIEAFQKALKLLPGANRIHYSLGLCWRAKGDMEKAKVHIAQIGKVGPKEVDPKLEQLQKYLRGERVFTMKGKTAFLAKRYDEAASYFQKAVQSKPESTGALINYATALGMLNLPEEAIAQYKEVLRLDEGHLLAHYNLGLVYANLGRVEEAETHLKTVLEKDESDLQATLVLAGLYYRQGQFEKSLPLYVKVNKKAPLGGEALLNQVTMVANYKDYQEAARLLEEGHARVPQDGLVAHGLARFLATCPDKSYRNGERALELATLVYRANADVDHKLTMAMAYAELGECAEAAKLQAEIVVALEGKAEAQLMQRMTTLLQHFEKGKPCRL